MDLTCLVDLIHHCLKFVTYEFLHMDFLPVLAMGYSLNSSVYTLLNCSFNASAFNESSLTIDPPTCKSPMPWLSCLSFEMKVQNDFGLSVMLVVRNWLIWDTLPNKKNHRTFNQWISTQVQLKLSWVSTTNSWKIHMQMRWVSVEFQLTFNCWISVELQLHNAGWSVTGEFQLAFNCWISVEIQLYI